MVEFSASATAEGNATTNTNYTVTATSSASANSEVSYEDALNTATSLAQNYANETANYDANIINQAVSISSTIATEKMMYNMREIDSPPDLTLYYSVNSKYYKTYQITLGTIAIQQFGELIAFSDMDLLNNIGTVTGDNTIYKYFSNNLFPSINLRSFFLSNGNIFFVSNSYVYKNNDGNYILPGNYYTYQIVSGSGEYLNKRGILTINITGTLRKVNVYFNVY